ncbi:MAG: hypothetical protein KAS66_03530 [Candidatus Omnitrophica bacterium]|nr:hypothetical protein [Candidatus Omnitrophota bacterium]
MKLKNSEIMELNKTHLEHLVLLTFSFLVLDLASTFIGLQLGLVEAGILFVNSTFAGIVKGKIFFLLIIFIIYFSVAKNGKPEVLNKGIYFVVGINGGIFIANMTQIYYQLTYQ